MTGSRRLGSVVPFLVAVAAGAALEIVVTRATGHREAWDAPAYWIVGYPALILVSAVLGWSWPGAAGRLGFVTAIAQVLTMMVRTGGGSLWPLGLMLGAALGVPCALAAIAGRRMRGPARPTTP